jgi:hypothetical protein
MRISIRKDFAVAPGFRLRVNGNHSGQEFREDILVPKLRAAIEAGEVLVVDLDGTAGYAPSFLEESFGGLIREEGFTVAQLARFLDFNSTEEPQLIEETRKYIQDAKPKSDGGNEN